MKHQIHIGESITIPLLEALLRDQVADGDAEGAARTRRMLEKLQDRQRLRHQAIRAGRWPFHVDDGQKEGEPDD